MATWAALAAIIVATFAILEFFDVTRYTDLIPGRRGAPEPLLSPPPTGESDRIDLPTPGAPRSETVITPKPPSNPATGSTPTSRPVTSPTDHRLVLLVVDGVPRALIEQSVSRISAILVSSGFRVKLSTTASEQELLSTARRAGAGLLLRCTISLTHLGSGQAGGESFVSSSATSNCRAMSTGAGNIVATSVGVDTAAHTAQTLADQEAVRGAVERAGVAIAQKLSR